MYRALYAYDGSSDNQGNCLEFNGGDVIQVIVEGKDGWWEGEKDGKRGWFPASYVKPLDASDNSGKDLDEDLPAGWKALTTPEGKKYYLNTINNTTTWEYPIFPATLPSVIQLTTERDLVHADASSFSPPSSPTLDGRAQNGTSTAQSSKYRVINGICFPTTKHAKEQELLHPNKFSYCDYFWHDKEDAKHGYESGFSVLLQKNTKGKQISKEMSDFFKAREAVELQYAKGLTALANEAYAMSEEGTLGETWKSLKESMMYEAKLHKELASRLRTSVEKPLVTYKDQGKKEIKQMETSMSDLRKQCYIKFQSLEKAKQQMAEKQRDLETKMQSPKKSEEEITRARRKSSKQREDTGQAIAFYNQSKDRWFEEMVTKTLTLEKQEVERIEMIKKQLMKYCNLVQDVNNKSRDSLDEVKQRIKSTDTAKDRELWVRSNKTGTIRPVDIPK